MEDDAASPVIGVILMIAIVVGLSALVAVLVLDKPVPEERQSINFKEDNDELVVVTINNGPINWSDVAVNGCTTVPTGQVNAGDRLQGCSGRVTVAVGNALIVDQLV